MNTTRIARLIALPIVSAGIIGGAALGLAGAASAATTTDSPSIVATPSVKAHPAPNAIPGHHWHHGMWHLQDLEPGYHR